MAGEIVQSLRGVVPGHLYDYFSETRSSASRLWLPSIDKCNLLKRWMKTWFGDSAFSPQIMEQTSFCSASDWLYGLFYKVLDSRPICSTVSWLHCSVTVPVINRCCYYCFYVCGLQRLSSESKSGCSMPADCISVHFLHKSSQSSGYIFHTATWSKVILNLLSYIVIEYGYKFLLSLSSFFYSWALKDFYFNASWQAEQSSYLCVTEKPIWPFELIIYSLLTFWNYKTFANKAKQN